MPGPLRSKEFPYGFDDLDEKKRTEVDKGTVMMARSVEMCKAMRAADADQRVPGFFALENPPPTDHHSHVSAWHMDELVDLVETTEAWCSAFFNTCSYEDDVPLGERHYKPQLVGGTLPGILSLSRMGAVRSWPFNSRSTLTVFTLTPLLAASSSMALLSRSSRPLK